MVQTPVLQFVEFCILADILAMFCTVFKGYASFFDIYKNIAKITFE